MLDFAQAQYQKKDTLKVIGRIDLVYFADSGDVQRPGTR